MVLGAFCMWLKKCTEAQLTETCLKVLVLDTLNLVLEPMQSYIYNYHDDTETIECK